MTGFHDEGPVAFAWITHPLRANTNSGFVLVNGQPPILNVEDLKLLDTRTVKESSQFQDLEGQFPDVDVWREIGMERYGPTRKPEPTGESNSP
jgi:hypothetical protein